MTYAIKSFSLLLTAFLCASGWQLLAQPQDTGIAQKGSAKQWITEKPGIIKQETYTGKGKMVDNTELTAFRGFN